MKIKTDVLEQVNESNRIQGLLQIAFNVSSFTIRKWIKDNEDDGDLTKESALKIIREELGLTNDEILEETSKAAA